MHPSPVRGERKCGGKLRITPPTGEARLRRHFLLRGRVRRLNTNNNRGLVPPQPSEGPLPDLRLGGYTREPRWGILPRMRQLSSTLGNKLMQPSQL
eukprot:15436256-Alexandrium_andersonii.AAC.1